MLDAYCWPLSAAAGDAAATLGSPPTPGRRCRVTRDGADSRGRVRADDVRPSGTTRPPDASANGCGWPVTLEIPTDGWRSGYYAVDVTAGDERADACFVVRPRPDDPRPDPPRARHHHVERLQRLGRAVALHRRDPRLVRASVREGLPGEAGAGRPHDADHARPRGDGLSELGAAAGPVRLERGRGMVELGTAVPALGGVERLPGGRRDVARPRGAPGGPARATG